jgi:hypothetical protein
MSTRIFAPAVQQAMAPGRMAGAQPERTEAFVSAVPRAVWESVVGVKDHSSYYQAGAQALKRLAARCGEARIAQIFESQAERFLLMAQVTARKAAVQPPADVVPAKRPTFSLRRLPEDKAPSARARRSSNVVDLASARGRREG